MSQRSPETISRCSVLLSFPSASALHSFKLQSEAGSVKSVIVTKWRNCSSRLKVRYTALIESESKTFWAPRMSVG